MLERLEEMQAPGVVHQHLRPARMGGPREGGNVLHLESMAAGTFRVHDRGVGANQGRDLGLGDGRRIISGLDSES